MVTKKALLLGASGLTGGQMLKQLLQDDAYEQVIIYGRKSFPTTHPKLVKKVINFEKLNTAVEVDEVFCCLGTTIKKAGSKKAFEEVDLKFPLKVAKLQKEAGSSKFIVVSSMGADARSAFFYNQVKGKMEEGLKALGFPCLFILRPSIISGKRNEKRGLEKLAIALFKIIDPLLIGPFRKFQPVPATVIAKAMVHYANSTETGTQIILSDTIKKFEF